MHTRRKLGRVTPTYHFFFLIMPNCVSYPTQLFKKTCRYESLKPLDILNWTFYLKKLYLWAGCWPEWQTVEMHPMMRKRRPHPYVPSAVTKPMACTTVPWPAKDVRHSSDGTGGRGPILSARWDRTGSVWWTCTWDGTVAAAEWKNVLKSVCGWTVSRSFTEP